MIIYASDGTERCEVQKFTYHGTFMGECFLNMDVTSPSPIPFEIGDYCDFRGERFYLNYIPAKEKTASLNSRGDAFRYSSMKMNSAADELTRCKFKDIVPSSYNVVWTGLPNFTFYAQTAQNLADRIQANLDAMYTGDKKWTVNVITANLVDYNKVKGNLPIDAEMSFNDKSCMEALAEFYNTFKVVYIIRGRTITVAPDGTSVGATFGYGPDAGLYDLQQQTKQDSLIVTRLYVYGSTRNIGTHYYANLTGKAVATVHDSTSKYCVVQYTFTGGQSFTESSYNFATYEFLLNGTDFHKYSSDGSMTASDIAAWVATQPFSGWTVTANGDIVTFTATESGDKTGNFGFQVSYTGTGTYTLPKATHVVTMASSSDISEYASATFTILGPSDAGVNYHIVLGGDTFNIETTNSLSTAAAVADFIASHTFTGWTVSHATGETSITFTAQNAGLKYPFTFYYLNLVGQTLKGATASIVVSSYGLKKYDTVTKGSYTYFYVYLNFEYGNSYYKNKVYTHDENEYKVTLKTGNISVTGYMFVDLSAKVLARVYSDDPNYNAFKAAITDSSTIYITDGVYLDLLSSEYVNYDETISGNLAVNNLMLPDFPLVHNNPNDVYIDDAAGIAKYGIREASVTFDGSDSAHPEVCPTIKEMTAKEVEDAGISLSLDPSEGTDLSTIRLDEVKACDMPTDSTNDGNLPTATDNNYNSWQKTFVIYIKDLGFDLTFMSGDNYYYATSDKMQISMISGPCTGRTFDITKIEKDTSLGYLRYKLTCDRYQDTNINKVYPYDDYPITGGNQFVLLNIRLPKVYVDANAQKLLVYGNAYLSKNNSTKYTYIPKVSEIWMAKHADIANNIKEGDLFDFSDTDFNISDSVFIKTLSITVGDKAIPSYDITLDDETESSTIQKMQNQIDDVVVSGGVTDSSVVNALIANYAKTNLVSKVNDDEVGGNITFDKNVKIKGILTLGNDIAIKNLSATTLTVDNDAGIGGGLTVGGSTSLKDVTATTGDFSGLLKAAACTVAGLITAGSVLATNLTNSKIPYQTSAGLADSSLVTDGTNLSTAGTITSPTFIGELNGNSATATKLKTARTIWGQSFDGTGNVNGDINIGNANIIGYNGARVLQNLNGNLGINPTNNVGIGTTSPAYKLDVNGTLHSAGAATLSSTLTAAGLITANGGTHTTALTATALSTLANTNILGDAQLSARVMSPDYVSQTTGWGITRAGAADFRNIYADELRVQAFTADISQALAGSDYLTKSVSKLSANFVVPAVNSTVRIIVDDIEGMPATQCFTNGDYIRFRAFNRTSGLIIANVWGTVVLDKTFGTNGFSNGTQAYTFTCKATSGAGLTVFKGSEVLDYGTSGSGLIARTTLDAMGSPYEQIATWVNDPSNGNNYTVHARLGNLGGIANCNGYGLYSDNVFLTKSIVIGDLTKSSNYLSFDTVNGLQIKLGGTSVATTSNVSDAQTAAQNYATINCVKTDASNAPTTILNSHVSIGSDGTLNNAGGGKVTIGGLGYSGDLNATNGAPSGTYVGSTLAQTIESKANNAVDNGTYTTYINAESGRIDARISQQLVSGGSIYTAASLTLDGNGISLFGKSVDISSATVFNSVVKTTDYNGNTIASLINQTATTVAIQANKINLLGAVTISAIDTSSVTPSALGAATPTDVTTAVDDIQIGGRNLLKGTRLLAGSSFNGRVASESTVIANDYSSFTSVSNFYKSPWNDLLSWSNVITPTPNTYYVLSFYAKSTVEGDTINSYFYPDTQINIADGATNTTLTTEWAKYVVTWHTKSDVSGVKSIVIARLQDGNGTGTVSVCGVKFEEGNKATDWSPAPEDVDANIATAQSTADSALTRNNTMAVKLGYTDYNALASAAALGHTLIDGGMINTVLINATAVVTNGLTANCITSNMISAGSVTADKLATNVLSVGNISGLGSLATQNSLAYDGSYITNKPTSLSAINTTEGTKLGGIAAGATVGATWGTNVAGIPTNLSSLTGAEGIKNTLITISANGTLSGAGGGQVTVSGIGACTPTQAQGYATTSQTSAQDNLATKLGYTNYSDLVTKAASTDFGTLVVGGYLNTALIQAQAISTNMLAAGSVTADKIAANTITATQIAAGTITTTQLNATDIISNLIEANNISTGKLTVTGGSHLGALTVGSDGSLTCGSNYSMSSSGTLTVNNATIHGNITANTFATANNTFTADANGNITCNNGTFNNVKITGGIRSPFTFSASSLNTDYTDNVSLFGVQAGTHTMYQLPWDVSQNGRHITLTNYLSYINGVDSTSLGFINIIAPSGKYFYEDGIRKNTLIFSREVVELVGYGNSTNFYGWIVTNRRDLMTTHSYGKNLKALAMGRVYVNSTTDIVIDAIAFDGNGGFSISRISQGVYDITCPSSIVISSANSIQIIATGIGYSLQVAAASPRATVPFIDINNNLLKFRILMADNGAIVDSSFSFTILNMSDFVIN